MQLETMSSEELAASFLEKNQNQNSPVQKTNALEPLFFGGKSSEQLAAEFEQNKNNPDLAPDAVQKTPEQIAEAAAVKAELEANKKPSNKTKLDDSFKQGLDRLFKEQKLNPYSDGTETGYVLPETFEEVLELIEDNKNSWIESAKNEDKQKVFEEFLSTQTPAFQFLIQNSNKYRNPEELIPLLTAVGNQEFSDSLDITEEADQETIIRSVLSLQGLQLSAIEDEISDLKERGRLESRASSLKPVLDKYNEQKTQVILQEKAVQEEKDQKFWNDYYSSLEETLFKAKEIDGIKLKTEHKQTIAKILVPDDSIGGLPIYTIIDNLIAKKDFVTLSKIALLGSDAKLFDSYFVGEKANKKADGIQKVLRQSGVSANPTEGDHESKLQTIQKSKYGFY